MKTITLLFTLLFTTQIFGVGEEQCLNAYENELKRIFLEDKEGILEKQFRLTTLKLAREVSAHHLQTLEEHIKTAQKDVEHSSKDRLKEIENHFEANLVKDFELVDLKKIKKANYFKTSSRLNNIDLSYLMYQSRQSGDETFTKSDAAIAWYMGKVANVSYPMGSANYNQLQISTLIAHSSGAIDSRKSLNLNEIESEIESLESRIKNIFSKAKTKVAYDKLECLSVLENQTPACIENMYDQVLFENLNFIEPLKNKMSLTIGSQAPKPKNKPINQTNSKSKQPISSPSGQSKSENSCSSKRFLGGEKELVRIGPSKPQIAKAVSNQLNTISKMGICGVQTSEPTLEYEEKDIQTCCNNKNEWKKRRRLSIYGGSVDFNCRAFYGLPYIAEVGVRVGARVRVAIGGEVQPSKCESKQCIIGRLPLDVYSALYGDLASGGLRVQGGVKWKPRLQAYQCFKDSGKAEPLELVFRAGTLELYYTIEGAWRLFTYENALTIYESEIDVRRNIAIF